MSAPACVLRFGRYSLQWRPRVVLLCAALWGVCLGLAMVLLGTGTLAFTHQEILNVLVGGDTDPIARRVILDLRLPRVLTAVFVGSSLGMAGSIFQSISRNPLGSPDIVGFTTGAATGAIVQIVLFDAGPLAVSLAAVASGMATAAIVFLLALKGHAGGGHQLVLTGIGAGATLAGLNTVLLVTGDLDRALSAQIWLAGSLTARSWSHVGSAAAALVLIAPVALHYGRRLSLLEMGDDAASQLGVPVERTRLVMVTTAVSLTATATAAAGPITFVALAAPQLARRLGRSPDVPLVAAAAMGAALLLLADVIGQRSPFHLNMPIGLTTGLLGGLYLLWLLARRRTV